MPGVARTCTEQSGTRAWYLVYDKTGTWFLLIRVLSSFSTRLNAHKKSRNKIKLTVRAILECMLAKASKATANLSSSCGVTNTKISKISGVCSFAPWGVHAYQDGV